MKIVKNENFKQKQSFLRSCHEVLIGKNQFPRIKTVACRRTTHTDSQRKWKLRIASISFFSILFFFCFSGGGSIKIKDDIEKYQQNVILSSIALTLFAFHTLSLNCYNVKLPWLSRDVSPCLVLFIHWCRQWSSSFFLKCHYTFHQAVVFVLRHYRL